MENDHVSKRASTLDGEVLENYREFQFYIDYAEKIDFLSMPPLWWMNGPDRRIISTGRSSPAIRLLLHMHGPFKLV